MNEQAQTETETANPNTKGLNQAILEAQRLIEPMGTDGTNSHQGYSYTRGDSVIKQAGDVLNACECLVRRRGWKYIIKPDDVPAIKVEFEILHVPSGESLRESVKWYFIEGKGRPADKAVAAALTSSFSYWLLGHLAIPRSKEDAALDMSGRNDYDHGRGDSRRGNQRQQQRQAQPRQQQRQPPKQQQTGPTEAQWINIAGSWKKSAQAIVKDPALAAPEKIAELTRMQAAAEEHPTSDGIAHKWPVKIWGFLVGYLDGFRSELAAPAPAEQDGPPDDIELPGDNSPAADAATADTTNDAPPPSGERKATS